MIFNKILIADLNTKTAKLVNFIRGINVITSEENHVGKSSLVKSLYYSLGAEVGFDEMWDKKSKLYITEIIINNDIYKFVRHNGKFAILKNDNIELITESVSVELAKYYEYILNFSVYLPNKNTGKHELAPPVFTFLPYYIDQDTGWGMEPYTSFKYLEQYNKKYRQTSLYYHLGVYNKDYIDLLAKIDKNKNEILSIDEKINEIKSPLGILQKEASYLIQSENIQEFDLSFVISKETLEEIIKDVSISRDKVQKLESQLLQYSRQKNIIKEYNKIRGKNNLSIDNGQYIPACPKCGHVMSEEIYKIVQNQYSIANEEFILNQIEYLINKVNEQLKIEKNNYISLVKNLKNEEEKIQKQESKFEIYTKLKGLNSTIKHLETEYNKLSERKVFLENENKNLEKEKRKILNKKQVDTKYEELLHSDLLALGAWNSKFEKQLKISQPLKAQGTLSSKIILSQYTALFKTMNTLSINNIPRFPFVIDSPRTKEASKLSSKEILDLILNIESLPQTIIVTVDFKDYVNPAFDYANTNIVTLTEEFKLLNNTDYELCLSDINNMYSLLKKH